MGTFCTVVDQFVLRPSKRPRSNIHFSMNANRPDGVGTVTYEEKEKFQEIKERLRILLENQITNFRYCFPFGRPEGALKATLSLLERVRQCKSASALHKL